MEKQMINKTSFTEVCKILKNKNPDFIVMVGGAVLNEDYADKTIDAIRKGAYTGNIGDGKIFVLELPRCIRIRTGEEGPEAIG